MALTNSQKSRIVKVAQENGYQGDYEELFEQAKTEGIFGEVPEPDVSDKKNDYNLDPESVLVNNNIDIQPLNAGNENGSDHINDAYELNPGPDSLMQFISDPQYKIQPQQQGEKGGFKKYNAGGSVDLLDESKLNIVTDAYDPWEYTKDVQGQIHTRKKAVGENGIAGDWITPEKGTTAYTAIKDTITFKDTSAVIGGLNIQDTNEVKDIYNQDKSNSENKLESSIHTLLNKQANNTSGIQSMLVDNGYDLGTSGSEGNGVDGDWGSMTSAAFSEWSSKNINLPNYQGVRKDICIAGDGCSDKVTTMLTDLFPGVTRDELGPEDAWYRAKHVVELGGEKLWGVSDKVSRGEWDDLPDLPPVDVWKNLQIGDLIHLNRKGDTKAELESKAGYGLDMNRNTEHVGFVIGKDEETGLPLIMHGGKDMEIDKINDIALTKSPHLGQFKIDAITRSKGTKDRKPNLKDHYIFNAEKTDHLVLSNPKSETNNPLKTDNYFATRFVNNINTNINRIASTTGYSKEAVAEASRIAYGVFKTETGDWEGIVTGGAKEFAKDNIDADILASGLTILKTGKDFIKTGNTTIDYVSPKTDETSIGAGRIKFDMQTKDAEGNPTQIGKWYKSMNITKENMDFGANNFIDKSFDAITLQVLHYNKLAKQHKEYDEKTNTVAGVPLQYVVSTMHKSPNLNKMVYNNKTVLQYLKEGDRDYANSVMEHTSDIKVKYDKDGSKSTEYHKAKKFIAEKNTDEELNRKLLNDYLQQLQELPSDNTQINIPKIEEIK